MATALAYFVNYGRKMFFSNCPIFCKSVILEHFEDLKANRGQYYKVLHTCNLAKKSTPLLTYGAMTLIRTAFNVTTLTGTQVMI
jgi:hypothetical protein